MVSHGAGRRSVASDQLPGRTVQCIVCRGQDAGHLQTVASQTYWRCPDCRATFLDPKARLGPEDELAHYRHHRNDPDDPRYRRFLAKLSGPLLTRLTPGQTGLDYGCGPGPALAAVLREAGYPVALWDPFFAPDDRVLEEIYDFITCTEVAEHMFDPAAEFDRLGAMLRPGGWLAVMTCFQTEDARFGAWHYRKDPTHVVFYRAETFRVIARQRGWTCTVPVKDVVLMQAVDGSALSPD